MKITTNKPALFLIFVVMLLIGMVFFILKKDTFQRVSKTTSNNPGPTTFMQISPPNQNTSSWKTFTQPQLKFSIKYPSSIMLDPKQTVEGRLYAFIFTTDEKTVRTNTIPTLYIADTHSAQLDGFTAFKKSDCGKNCQASATDVQWVTINNVYGIKSPLSGNIDNYYLTDKKQSGDVINVYVGNDTNQNSTSQNKITLFDQMIKTIQFER